MAESGLPKVLMLWPPPVYEHFQSEFCRNFHFVKAYESSLPIADFLASSPIAASATAMFVTSLGSPISADILRRLPALRCIVTSSVAIDYIDLAECHRRRISVASQGDVTSDDSADTAVVLLIDVLRKISAGDRYVRHRSWKTEADHNLGSKLGGKKVGILGLGKIGSKIATRLNAFGCKVAYTSRTEKLSVPYRFYPDLLDLAKHSDVLIVSCALTEETRHLVNKQVLTALGKEGIIVNIARGAIIDETELVSSLVQGRTAGAALDVFEHEPFVPEELREMENVVLTPHTAVHTKESYRGVYECVTANLKAFFLDQPLLTPVLDYS